MHSSSFSTALTVLTRTVLIGLTMAGAPIHAAEMAAEVETRVGEVIAHTNQDHARSLEVGDPVFSGDTIITPRD